MTPESEAERERRQRQRVLFGRVAALYDATRQSYPAEVLDAIVAATDVLPDGRVLEIGCGTGQLTEQLVARGLQVTALDISAEMVALARQRLSAAPVRFQVCAFEEFDTTERFDLIVSATAFHWVDPALAWTKTAALLRPDGWLALLTTGERHHEPLRAALRDLWVKHNPQPTPWQPRAPWAQALRDSKLFGDVIEVTHEQELQLPASTVIDVECTRATFLSWDEDAQRAFRQDLAALVQATPSVSVTQETLLAMAPAVGGGQIQP